MEATDPDLEFIMTPAPEPAPEEAPEADTTEPIAEDDAAPVDEDGAEDVESDQTEDEGQDDEGEADEQPEQVFTVKVDGEDRQVTLDELTRSYAGQGYIQKRMQENAAKAKEVEAVFQSVMQERQMLAHLVEQVKSGQLVTPPTPPDHSLREKDPLRYMRERDAFEQKKAAYDQQQQQIAAFTQQNAEAQQRAMAAYQAEQMRELTARLPEFADPERAAVLAKQLTDAAAQYGFGPEELGQVNDHRAILILADAAKYRQLQQQREKVAAKVEQARPIVRPKAARGAEPSQQRQAAVVRNRMKSTGSVDDVAAWLIQPKP